MLILKLKQKEKNGFRNEKTHSKSNRLKNEGPMYLTLKAVVLQVIGTETSVNDNN